MPDAEISKPVKVDLNSLDGMWPLYHPNEVVVGNVKHPLAVSTLWTERQGLEKILGKDEFCAIGQCFSPRGVSLTLRELLINPNITILVTWGRDATKTGEQIKTFFENGFNGDYTLPGFGPSIKLHEEIPKEELEMLRKKIEYVDLRGKIKDSDYKGIAEALRILEKKKGPWRDYGMIYPMKDFVPDKMPGELTGYVARGETVGETWLDLLDTILRFGRVKNIPGEDSKIDIVNLMAVVNGKEDYLSMANPEIFKYIPDFRGGVERYVEQFTSGKHLEGSAYSYGEELLAHETENGKREDQIEYIVGKLSKSQHTGRAFGSTWNVGRHMKAPEGPCLVDVQFAAIGETEESYKLSLTAHFKTHDMFSAWPANVFGLRELQKLVFQKLQNPYKERGLSLELGPLATISASAHFYGGQTENAQKTLKEFPLSKNRHYNLPGGDIQDPRGNYTVGLTDANQILIEHVDTTGMIFESKEFGTRTEAEKWIGDKRVSYLEHAVYLGREIGRAALAQRLIQNGIPVKYEQGKRIKLNYEGKEIYL